MSVLFSLNEGLKALGGFFGCNALAAVVQVYEHVAVVAHAELFHVGELAQTVAGLDALHQVVVLGGCHGVYDIDAGLVYSQDVGR